MERKKAKTRVVGVDVGLLTTTYAIVDIRGNIIAQESFATGDYPNIDSFVAVLCDSIFSLIQANGGYEEVRSVGVCCPSSNHLSGCIENSPNMPWKGVIPLAALMRDRLGLAVALANNSQCIGLGELAFGSAHGMKNFIVITLGHGMGSCFFSREKMHLGSDGFAGEIGHCCVVDNGRQCSCGHKGCLETYCSERGVLQTAREILAESEQPSLMRQVDKLSPKIISEFCEKGDQLAIEVYRRTGEVLGFGLANYASVVNPEALILTGGIPHAGHWLLEPAEQAFNKYVFPNVKGKTRLLVSMLKDGERDVLGASILAWSVKEYSLFL